MESTDRTARHASPNGASRASRDPGPEAGAGRELSAAWAEIRRDLSRLGAEFRTVGALRLQRARLATHEGLHAVLLGGWVALAAASATVVSAAILVLGVAGAIAALTGFAWIGLLAGGLLSLLASLSILMLLRGRMRAEFQAEVARKYPLDPEGEADS